MSQIVLERNTNLSTKKVLEKAKKTFVDKHGLTLEEEASCCLRLKGGGGFVTITIQEEEDQTKVEIKSREWADISKQFIQNL